MIIQFYKILKLSVIWVAVSAFATSLAHAGSVIIAHPSNTAQITPDEVERLYLAKKKKFSDGSAALPLNHKEGSALRMNFDKAMVNKTPAQMKAYWSKLIFTGKEVPLKEVESDAEMIEFVSKNPSVLGYIDEANVTPSVKVVHKF